MRGGVLVQDRDTGSEDRLDMQVVTERKPTEPEWGELQFAMRVCKHVRSNAIVLAKDLATAGVGAGQMSRVDSVRISVDKARAAGIDLTGAALASDAFFPFADGPEHAIEAGVRSIIQPGGSQRDPEVIDACDRAGVAMVFTARRHFRHGAPTSSARTAVASRLRPRTAGSESAAALAGAVGEELDLAVPGQVRITPVPSRNRAGLPPGLLYARTYVRVWIGRYDPRSGPLAQLAERGTSTKKGAPVGRPLVGRQLFAGTPLEPRGTRAVTILRIGQSAGNPVRESPQRPYAARPNVRVEGEEMVQTATRHRGPGPVRAGAAG